MHRGPLLISESGDRLDEPPAFDSGIAVRMLFEKINPTPGVVQIKTNPILRT